MATKEQERKALEKIKAIMEELGDDSYIGMAFEGCISDAEENIENDFGLSMSNRWQCAMQKAQDLDLQLMTTKQEYEETRRELDQTNKYLQETLAERDDAQSSAISKDCEIDDLKARLDAKDKEIITLKAKLYDLITAEH